jgi:chromosome segregation ATPase
LLHGPEQVADLSRIAALEPDSQSRVELGTTVSQLGSMTWTEVAAEALRHLEVLQQRLEEMGAELSPLRQENGALRARLDALLVAYDARTAVVADVQARLFDANREIERLTKLAAENKQKQAQALARRDSALAAARDEMKAQATLRDAEIAALTLRLDRLLASTSWKVMEPARSIVRLVRPRQ